MADSLDVVTEQTGAEEDATDLADLHPAQGVWKTDDPRLTARLRRSFQGPPSRLVDLDLDVLAEVWDSRFRSRSGRPLAIARSPEAPDPWRRRGRSRPMTACCGRRIIALYQDLLAGRRDARTAWRDLKASSQYGVTRGPLNVL